MPKHGRQILVEALKLPPVERAELVENLLTSFEFQSRKTIDALWAEEAEDRIDAFERPLYLCSKFITKTFTL